ncbi:hypothetical protein amyaer_2736 [Microcystis aeruginosa NIES-2481]|nr:hypothetical protein amyaer_2736 [Microcystis aeruginosa NIES-2481]
MIDSAVNQAFYLNSLWQPPTSRSIVRSNPTPHTPHTLSPRKTFSANPS